MWQLLASTSKAGGVVVGGKGKIEVDKDSGVSNMHHWLRINCLNVQEPQFGRTYQIHIS